MCCRRRSTTSSSKVPQGGARCGARRWATAGAAVAKTSPATTRCVYVLSFESERRAADRAYSIWVMGLDS